MSYIRETTILGGLPVIVEVSFGRDSFTGEDWAEVEHIWWRKRNGKAGKEIPSHLRDKAEKYDCYFADLLERVIEQIAYEYQD